MLTKSRWGDGVGSLGGHSRDKKRATVATVRRSGVRGWSGLGVVRSLVLRFPLCGGNAKRADDGQTEMGDQAGRLGQLPSSEFGGRTREGRRPATRKKQPER